MCLFLNIKTMNSNAAFVAKLAAKNPMRAQFKSICSSQVDNEEGPALVSKQPKDALSFPNAPLERQSSATLSTLRPQSLPAGISHLLFNQPVGRSNILGSSTHNGSTSQSRRTC